MEPILYIVVPCYNEEAVLDETTKRLGSIIDNMMQERIISRESKILYVDDGSKDRTWSVIDDYCKRLSCVSGIKLAANVGHQNALMAGLLGGAKKADVIVSIDADLQDDVTVIPEMVKLYLEGYDIVYGVRKSRKTDTLFKRTTALAFYKFMIWLGVKTIYNSADFRLMSKRSVFQLEKYREKNLFLRGLVPLIGYKTTRVFYDRAERFAGESKYPLKKMLNFAVDGITSFSVKPVRMVLGIGIMFLMVFFGILVYVVSSFITGNTVPGWVSIILSIWFIGACVLIGLGVVGEYIGKIYLEVKDRPRYNIEEMVNL